jgi:putative ABC transport system permease protein
MSSLLNQIGVVTSLNLRSIPQRAAMSIASVVAVALAITVLLFFLALANGLKQTVEGSGADDVVIALREGSNAELNSVVVRDQLNLLAGGPGVAVQDGRPVVSGELLVIVDGIKKSTNSKANMPFRGISPEGVALRHGVRITQGRMFTPGANEIVVGRAMLEEFAGFEYGKTIRLRGNDWKVVGVFEAPGTVFESELWADIAVTQSLFKRPNTFQTLRVKLNSAADVGPYKAWAAKDARLKQVEILTEREYYAKQAAQSTAQFTGIAWALGITMAIGALAGALNTMYASVAARSAEIATLRIIGFSGFAAFVGSLVESLALCVLGGLGGVLLAFIAFNGRTTSTLGSGFTQLVFKFDLSPQLVATAVVMALVIGLLGGVMPGIKAARQRPLLELAGA